MKKKEEKTMINIRLTVEEKELIKKNADKYARGNISAYLVMVALGKIRLE